MTFPRIRVLIALAAAVATAHAGEDMAQANGYDDAWQAAWIGHCREVFTSEGKTAGLVLQVGDSITHANPYSAWPRHGAGRTPDDAAIIAWCHAEAPFSGSQNDPANPNGFYLAAADTTGARGMTCAGGLDTAEFLAGANNGGAAMPDESDRAKARAILADGQYSHDLRASTLAAAYSDAQIAVLMLGTNDVKSGRPAGEVAANLGKIVDLFEAKRIVVVLSTIPPWPDAAGDQVAAQISEAIAKLARERGLPLIDYRAEILARRPGGSANGTLMGAGDVHPSAGDSAADPYANGGDPATHRTGAACRDSGYLLRSWLTIQKLKEVKAALVDGVGAGATAKAAPTAGDPAKPAKPGAKPAKPAKR